MYSFSYLKPICCSMSSSYCCFLTCIQIFQEASQVVWYSHLLKNFPQFIVIHTVKGFGIVNKAEIAAFLELSLLAFSMIQRMLAIWSLVPLPFLKPAWTSGSSWFMYCWSLAWKFLSITCPSRTPKMRMLVCLILSRGLLDSFHFILLSILYLVAEISTILSYMSLIFS